MEDPRDGREFAVKFFLQEEAFQAEAALYAACFPSLRTHLSAAGLCRSPPVADKGAVAADPDVLPSRTGNAATSPTQATQTLQETLHPECCPTSGHKICRR